MKNHIFKFVDVFLIPVIIFVLLFSLPVFTVRANNNNVVVKYTGTWREFPFQVKTDNYYIIADPTGLTTCSYTSPTYYYTNDNEVFRPLEGRLGFTAVLNSIVGVVLEPSNVSSFFTAFCNSVGILDTTSHYAKNGLYDTSYNFYGYAINDISGCTFNSVEADPIIFSKDYTDNVYNYFNYYDSENDDISDWFTFVPPAYTDIIGHNAQNSNLHTQFENFMNSDLTAYPNYFSVSYGKTNHLYDYGSADLFVLDDLSYVISSDSNLYDDFCTFFNIYKSNNRLEFDEIKDVFITTNIYFSGYFYNSNNVVYNTSNQYSLRYGTYSQNVSLGNQNIIFNANSYVRCPAGQPFTIYRSQSVKDSLDNQTYAPDYYLTDSYNQYDSNNDNSFDLNISKVNNSVTYNNTIFNDASEDFYNYYDNGYYDSSSSTTNITNITNNYYSDINNPDNPDNPDNPSDVLEQILAALLRFFTAIGSILGTILTGILTVVNEILEAIASLTTDLTGFTDFLSAIFGWIPEPVPQILGIGFSICILCGIIKFIRG